MEKYTATTAAEETTDAKPELVAHVAKTLEGVDEELARDLVSSVKGAAVFVLTYDSADEWGWGETLVLVPWTAVGTILIDGYHVPRIRRSLGLL